MNTTIPDFLWGAQAGSLQFAAACREHSIAFTRITRTIFLSVLIPPGKLPGGAGWQPALPTPTTSNAY